MHLNNTAIAEDIQWSSCDSWPIWTTATIANQRESTTLSHKRWSHLCDSNASILSIFVKLGWRRRRNGDWKSDKWIVKISRPKNYYYHHWLRSHKHELLNHFKWASALIYMLISSSMVAAARAASRSTLYCIPGQKLHCNIEFWIKFHPTMKLQASMELCSSPVASSNTTKCETRGLSSHLENEKFQLFIFFKKFTNSTSNINTIFHHLTEPAVERNSYLK